MAKQVVLTEECHQLLKVRAAQLGVSMGDAVFGWLHEASVPAPVRPMTPEQGEALAVAAWASGGYDEVAPRTMPAMIEREAFTGPFSKAAQMGKK